MLSTLTKGLRAALPYVALLFILAWIVNFFWFQSESRSLGGSALGGFIRDGHYYLSLDRVYTEVPPAVWERLRVHELIVIISFPVALACLAAFVVCCAIPALAGLRGGPAVDERVSLVQHSGEPLGGGRCGGSLAGASYSWPLLSVAVYPDGIVLHPVLAPSAVIRGEEVRRIEWQSRGNRVEITHRSPDVMSPITLYVATWTGAGAAIKTFEQSLREDAGGDSTA